MLSLLIYNKEMTMNEVAQTPFFKQIHHPHRLIAAVSATVLAVIFSVSAPLSAAVGQQEITLPELADVSCASYLVYNRTKGEIVISKEPDKKIYPASMTKIMTAALALEHLKPDQVLTVSQTAMNATTPNSTLMGLQVGEEVTVNELLFGLMLPSGNDAANVLAEAIVTATGYTDPAAGTAATAADGTETTTAPRSKLSLFPDIMNQKATELGLSNTHFENANGLHSDNHYTTASDLAKIFDYAVASDDFRTVISSATHVYKATNKRTLDAWGVAKNTNCLLTDPWILGADTAVAKVIGGKTGTTIPGGTGMTLLSVDKNGDELISVVCGIPYETANRLTIYMAAILRSGAQACFDKDPVVRVAGNVMDNKPYNAPAGQGPIGDTAITPTAAPTAEPTAVVTTSETTPSPTAVPADDHEKTGFAPLDLVISHPVISSVIGGIILIILVLVIVYFAANRKRRRTPSGIRRL